MCNPIFLLFAFLRSWFQSRLQLQAEIVALRHQVIVLRRSQKGRAHLRATDRSYGRVGASALLRGEIGDSNRLASQGIPSVLGVEK